MKILSNSKYDEIVQSHEYVFELKSLNFKLKEYNSKLEEKCALLEEKCELLQQERLRLNLTRDEKGVLHRITETKTSRINRKAKSDDAFRYSSEYFSDPVGVTKSAKHANEPEPKKFEPKDGEIVSVTVDDGQVGIVYFNGIGKDHHGINFDGEFSSCFSINKGDIIAPATKSQKDKLRKLDPKSKYNLRKMINSKSSKELATEYLGLKVGDGKICGYNDDWVIIGYSGPKKNGRWTPVALKNGDHILKEHKLYSFQTEPAKSAILKSLNPR